ncbi:hypothetical protein QVD17_21869 [Tagetes erecta]|uniref:Uncharacterized protein n=1 Tax=Tagetes erecta TaxID=13708 RepID=A0AAD8NTC7_TARER|nr:hypothetical protein QVD17_21869 [Tagetes erecta]
MPTLMEAMETMMDIKIEGVRTMTVDGFSRVDQKLTAIEELLKKIIETQNETGNSQEKRNGNVTVAIRGDKAEVSKDGDQRKQGLPWEAGSPHGWVGLYSHNYGKYSTQGTDFGRGKSVCGPAWVGQSESDFRTKDKPSFGWFHEGAGKGQFANTLVEPGNQRGSGLDGFGTKVAETGCVGKKSENDTEKDCSSLGKHAVKTVQDETFKDFLMSDKVTDKTYATGGEEQQTRSNKTDDKTDASLQDSLKPDQWDKKDVGLCFKPIQNKANDNQASMEADEGRDWSKIIDEKNDPKQVAIEGSNEQGHEPSHKPGSWGSKEEGTGSKRKHPDSPVDGRNDSTISSVPLTATRQQLSNFTTDEQEILNDIEPIMQSVQRIMYRDGYNDGDPLPADDQTYILDNVLNHHPGKAQKLGAGVDYIMISKYMNIRGSRCFHVVSTDGRKEDFSYLKCLKNFVKGKYPDKADKFIFKYFKSFEPRPSRNTWNHGSGPYGAGTHRSWSERVSETRSPAWRQMRAGHLRSVGTKQKNACWRPQPRGS